MADDDDLLTSQGHFSCGNSQQVQYFEIFQCVALPMKLLCRMIGNCAQVTNSTVIFKLPCCSLT